MKKTVLVLVAGLTLGGCETMSKQDLGMAAGAVIGAVVFQSAANDGRVAQRNAAILGALAGGLVGRQIGSYFDQREQEEIRKRQLEALETGQINTAIQANSGAVFTITEVVEVPNPSTRAITQSEDKPESLNQPQVAARPTTTPSKVPGVQREAAAPSAQQNTARSAPAASTNRPAVAQPVQRASAPSTPPPVGQCRQVSQRVNLPDGRSVNDQVTFCKRPPDPGTWQAV